MLNGGHFNFRKNKCWKCRRWLWLIHCHFCYSYCLESGLTNEKRRRSSEKSDSRPGCVKSSEILATSTCSVMQQPLQWCFDSVKELKHSVFYSSNVGTSCRLVLSIQQLMRSATWQELVRSQAVTNRKCLSGKAPSMGTNDVLFCHIITLWKKNNPPFIFFLYYFQPTQTRGSLTPPLCSWETFLLSYWPLQVSLWKIRNAARGIQKAEFNCIALMRSTGRRTDGWNAAWIWWNTPMCAGQMKEQRDAARLIVWRALAAWTAASKELCLLRGPSAFELDAHTVWKHLHVTLVVATLAHSG